MEKKVIVVLLVLLILGLTAFFVGTYLDRNDDSVNLTLSSENDSISDNSYLPIVIYAGVFPSLIAVFASRRNKKKGTKYNNVPAKKYIALIVLVLMVAFGIGILFLNSIR
jgi:H+/Cl- antiporter ClcA